MVGRSRRTKFFAQRQQLPWPAPATALVACILFPCTVALRALQACISSGIISSPFPAVTFPWMAWPILMMGALWFRHLDGAWFTSAAVTGRAIAAAALLGVLDGCGASLDFFVAQSCGDTATRQGMLLALLRCSDLPLAALLSGRSVLSALPVALGLGAASILAGLGAEGRAADEVLLAATAAAAAACRAVRCGLGKRLLRGAGVENSVQGLFFVGGFSGFFGSMLVLPMMLGQSKTETFWAPQLDILVMVAAVLLLGTADTIGRLAVLRHSDAVTAASLDAGLSPLASVMAHSTRGLAIHEGLPTELLALLVLLFSFLVQHQLAHSDADLGPAPVLLGRAGGMDLLGKKKLRDV